MTRMCRRSAHIAWIRAIMLEHIHACRFEETAHRRQVVAPPRTGKTGTVAEVRATRSQSRRINHIRLWTHTARCEQRIAAYSQTALMSVVRHGLHGREVSRISRL